MAYAIMRTAKLKTAGNVGASLSHTYRERETLNADPEQTAQNEILIEGNMEKMDQMLDGVKMRSDSVQSIELFMGASPDFFEGKTESQIDEWRDKSMNWAKETFGEQNILSAVMHKDEQTPHLSVHIVPVKDGKLNAKSWLGGREKLSDLQDNYHKAVEGLGLDRGERGSQARHEEVKKYYERVQEPIEMERVKLTFPSADTMDRINIDSYAKKVLISARAQIHEKVVAPLLAKIKELEKGSLQRERRIYRKQRIQIKGHAQEVENIKKEASALVREQKREATMAKSEAERSPSSIMKRDIEYWKDKAQSLETAVKMVVPAEKQNEINAQQSKLQREKNLQKQKIRSHERGGMER